MPEMFLDITWPDGLQESCYSPSRVVSEYFEVGASYTLAEFLRRSRVALMLASDRVKAKYGTPCPRALGQLARIEQVAAGYVAAPDARVRVVGLHL